jgi:hypothetical protein
MLSRLRRTTVILGATALLAGAITLTTTSAASADTQMCDKYGSARVSGGRYIVQNNEWGDSTTQCLSVRDDGFTITTANHNKPTNGAPASYPSIYAGCHYGNCTSGSGLPKQVANFHSVRSAVAYTVASGQWDASYDIWFDPNPNPSGQNTGAELMIWGNHQGAPQPIGSKIATVWISGASWDVWFGNTGWNVISYVRTSPTTSLNVDIGAFTSDSVARGKISRSWYLTSIQFGFEPWQGGAGLGVQSFSTSVS